MQFDGSSLSCVELVFEELVRIVDHLVSQKASLLRSNIKVCHALLCDANQLSCTCATMYGIEIQEIPSTRRPFLPGDH